LLYAAFGSECEGEGETRTTRNWQLTMGNWQLATGDSDSDSACGTLYNAQCAMCHSNQHQHQDPAGFGFL
jgi:hypothetical protein